MIGEPRRHEPECESTQLLLGAGRSRGRGRGDRPPDRGTGAARTDSGEAAGHVDPRLGRCCDRPAERRAAGADARRRRRGRGRGRGRDRSLRADQVAERRDARPAQGVRAGSRELRDGAVVLGIGINVNQTREQLPPDAQPPAGSLRSITGSGARPRRGAAPPCCSGSSTATTSWLDGGLDASTRISARATSCAAAVSRWTGGGSRRWHRPHGSAGARRGRRASAGRERRSRLLSLRPLLRPFPGARRLLRDRGSRGDVSRVGT